MKIIEAVAKCLRATPVLLGRSASYTVCSLAILAAACGGGGAVLAPGDAPRIVLDSIAATPKSAQISAGDSATIVVSAYDNQRNLLSGVTTAFTSSDASVASVSPTGVVHGVTAGAAAITVGVTAGSVSRSLIVPVSVLPPGASDGGASAHIVTTSGVSFVPGSITINAGDSVQWQISGATHNVTFGVAAPTGGSIGDTPPGSSVTRTFPTAGNYPYQCTRHAGMTGTVIVLGAAPPVYTTLVVTPLTPSIDVGGHVTIVAASLDQFGNPMTGLPAASFTTSNSAAATVDGQGVVTGVAAGVATITAALTSGGTTHTASATVTVTAPQPNAATVETPSLTFSPQSLTISGGTTVTWKFSGNTHNVTFGALKPSGGDIPDTPPGNAVSRTFTTAGTYDYQCTWHSGMTGKVIVLGATPSTYTSLSVSPQTPSIDAGSRITITATPLDQFGNAMTGLGAATFTTSNTAVATVDAQGVVTGVSGGVATITASLSSAGASHTASASVTVVAAQANVAAVETPGLTFSPQSVTIGVGGTVTWRFSDNTHNVTFGTLKPTGGNIPDTQPGNAVSRTFTTAGTYDYQCTRHSGMTGKVVVQNAGPGPGSGTLASLDVTPASIVLAPNGTARLTVTPRDSSGAPLAVAEAPTFVSSNTQIATVSAGLVTGVANGQATITISLTSDGVTRTVTVAVTVATPAATISTTASQFTPQELSIRPGQSVLFQFAGATHNVTFKDLRPVEGDVPNSAPGTSITRTFSAAGDYDFQCTWHDGMKGRIRVQ